MYSVKEIFKTLQGEGTHTGKVAIFCRFSGCNLWSGIESARKSALCQFCDTDFKGTNGVNGGKYTLVQLVDKVCDLWGETKENRFIVLTGGEPMLQVNDTLIEALKCESFSVAIETNGTISVPDLVDHICVSPKLNDFVQKSGEEIKVVFPDVIDPASVVDLPFKRFYIQPKDDKNVAFNTQQAIRYCLDNPQWRLSFQTHIFYQYIHRN